MIKRWVNPERGRYYVAVLSDDLFGGVNLLRFWGGCGSRRGGQLAQHFSDAGTIEEQLRRIANRRRQRGYVEAGNALNAPRSPVEKDGLGAEVPAVPASV